MLDATRIRESIRNRQLVREQNPMRGRELIGYLTLCSLIALPAVFVLWQQNAYVRTRFEIESLRKEKLALQERYRCLRIETGTLESLGRIEEEAKRNGLAPRDEASPAFILSGTPTTALAVKDATRPSSPSVQDVLLRFSSRSGAPGSPRETPVAAHRASTGTTDGFDAGASPARRPAAAVRRLRRRAPRASRSDGAVETPPGPDSGPAPTGTQDTATEGRP